MTGTLTGSTEGPFLAKHITGRLGSSVQRFGVVQDNLRTLVQKVCQPELTDKKPNPGGEKAEAANPGFVNGCELSLNKLDETLREIAELVDVLVGEFGSDENRE